jgi:hypothetical protein
MAEVINFQEVRIRRMMNDFDQCHETERIDRIYQIETILTGDTETDIELLRPSLEKLPPHRLHELNTLTTYIHARNPIPRFIEVIANTQNLVQTVVLIDHTLRRSSPNMEISLAYQGGKNIEGIAA